MPCCLWFRSVIWVGGPWPKHYGYNLRINNYHSTTLLRTDSIWKLQYCTVYEYIQNEKH